MHLLSAKQFDRLRLERLLEIAAVMEDPWAHKIDPIYQARGKVLGIIKNEGSTRTHLSFEIAMKRLGGDVAILDYVGSSMATKGESIGDTVRLMSEYVDALVVRSSVRDQVTGISKDIKIPIINAGDGDGEHPTQALLDLYTIKKELGGIDGKKFLFVGDLKHSRTVHSLIYALSLFKDVRINLASPWALKLDQPYINFLMEHKMLVSDNIAIIDPLLRAGRDIDVVYMTRMQTERHQDKVAPATLVLNDREVKMLKKGAIIMHPLPRGEELPQWVDDIPQAAYWRQARNGVYLRMALLFNLFQNGEFMP